MDLHIRRAEPSDLPAVKEMYAALVARMDREGWSVWDETYPRDFVGKDVEQGQFYLLLEGGRLAGAFALPSHDNGEGRRALAGTALPPPGICTGSASLWSTGARAWASWPWSVSASCPAGWGPGTCGSTWPTRMSPHWPCTGKRASSSCPGSLGSFCCDGTRLFEYAFEKRL